MNFGLYESPVRQAIGEIFMGRGPNYQHERFMDLQRAYSQRHRHFHTIRPITEMLSEAKRFRLRDPKAFLAAILYHDFVHTIVQHSKDSNAVRSATICALTLTEGSVPSDITQRAKAFILSLDKPQADDHDYDTRLFLDTTIAVIGEDARRYNEYSIAHARECLTAMTPREYMGKRLKDLETLAKQDTPIFKTVQFSSHEKQVRENVAWELKNLNGIIARGLSLNSSAIPQADYR